MAKQSMSRKELQSELAKKGLAQYGSKAQMMLRLKDDGARTQSKPGRKPKAAATKTTDVDPIEAAKYSQLKKYPTRLSASDASNNGLTFVGTTKSTMTGSIVYVYGVSPLAARPKSAIEKKKKKSVRKLPYMHMQDSEKKLRAIFKKKLSPKTIKCLKKEFRLKPGLTSKKILFDLSRNLHMETDDEDSDDESDSDDDDSDDDDDESDDDDDLAKDDESDSDSPDSDSD